MGPIVKDTEKAFAGEPIQFVTLDFTTEDTTRAAEESVAALGLEDLYAAQGKRTGQFLLINAKSKQQVGKLTAADDQATWHGEIRRLIDGE